MQSFVAVERYIMTSPAWRSLTPNGRAAYLEIGYGFDGGNNGRIRLSSQMLADRLGRDKSTAARAIRELQQKGFVDCVSKGGFNRKLPHASEWRLTAIRCDVTGQPPSKLFMRWQPEISESGGTGAASGGTGATGSQETTSNSPSRWHRCNRERQFESASGGTDATLLYSSQRGESPSVTELKEVAGSANTIRPGHTALVDWHGAALRTIEELAETIPPDLHSWAAPELGPSSSRH